MSNTDRLLVRPEAIAFGADLCFAGVFTFFPLRDLRAPSADRHEILHDDVFHFRYQKSTLLQNFIHLRQSVAELLLFVQKSKMVVAAIFDFIFVE